MDQQAAQKLSETLADGHFGKDKCGTVYYVNDPLPCEIMRLGLVPGRGKTWEEAWENLLLLNKNRPGFKA
jgi:hypothetical protein